MKLFNQLPFDKKSFLLRLFWYMGNPEGFDVPDFGLYLRK